MEEIIISKSDFKSALDISRGTYEMLSKDKVMKECSYLQNGQKVLLLNRERFKHIKSLLKAHPKLKFNDIPFEKLKDYTKNYNFTKEDDYLLGYFTQDMKDCYNRGCNCNGCFFDNFFSKYDIRYPHYEQSLIKCNLKHIVEKALAKGIKP